jgi:hypothetical protein
VEQDEEAGKNVSRLLLELPELSYHPLGRSSRKKDVCAGAIMTERMDSGESRLCEFVETTDVQF